MPEKRPSAESADGHAKKSKLDGFAALRHHSVISLDTADVGAIKLYEPHDATTNPSLVLKAMGQKSGAQREKYVSLIKAGVSDGLSDEDILLELVCFMGSEILKGLPPDGKVSIEVDANESFNVESSLKKSLKIADILKTKYEINKNNFYIKLASTFEGFKICSELVTKHSINVNMTLIFSRYQAIMATQHHASIISPFVGRITDWFKKPENLTLAQTNENIMRINDGISKPTSDKKEPAEFQEDADPGVEFVRDVYTLLKRHGKKTQVMAASFRTAQQVAALAGCDKITISPEIAANLQDMSADQISCQLSEEKAKSDEGARYKDWPNMTEANFRWFMNQDPMANDLLTDGIRRFYADKVKLLQEIATIRAA